MIASSMCQGKKILSTSQSEYCQVDEIVQYLHINVFEIAVTRACKIYRSFMVIL